MRKQAFVMGDGNVVVTLTKFNYGDATPKDPRLLMNIAIADQPTSMVALDRSELDDFVAFLQEQSR